MSANLADLRSAGAATESPFATLLAQPRSDRFDPDAYHAMQARDSALIADSVLNGYSGKEYVYSFSVSNTRVTGISVVGASALAAEYKGIKTRIVSAFDKTGSLFVMRTFDPPSMQVQHIPELEAQPDFYEVVVEVTDIKTGNSIQKRKKEDKHEKGRLRPHYDVIAESKAYRNAVLAIIPQDVVSKFEARALAAGNAESLKTKGDRIALMLKFAARNGVVISRANIESLTFDQIDGLSQAATESVDSFRRAAVALGISGHAPEQEPKPPRATAQPKATVTHPADMDPTTGEVPPPVAAKLEPAAPAGDGDGLDDWRAYLSDCDTAAECDDALKSYRGNPTGQEFRDLRKLCEARKAQIAGASE